MTSHLRSGHPDRQDRLRDLVAWLAGMATIRVAGAAFTALANLGLITNSTS